MNGKVNGGAYNSMNLRLYAYGANNPVKYVDLDGEHYITLGLAVAGSAVVGIVNQKNSGGGATAMVEGTISTGISIAIGALLASSVPTLGLGAILIAGFAEVALLANSATSTATSVADIVSP
jgi:hypothetical protein